MGIVVFDFDKTLYKRDSLLEFCFFFYKKHPERLPFLFLQSFFILLYYLRLIHVEKFKSLFIIFLWNYNKNRLKLLLNKFWDKEYPVRFNNLLLDHLSNYKKEGHEIIVATASFDMFIAPACKRLGIKKLYSTQLEYRKGRYKVKGYNCRGGHKIFKIRNDYVNLESVLIAAYSDNSDDKHLLSLAEKGYVIHSGKLNQLASFTYKNRDLSQFLKKFYNFNGIIDKLKFYYRPYICPFNKLLPYIEPGKKILDIGSGLGQFALIMAEFTKAERILGLELSDRLVNEAKLLVSGTSYRNQIEFESYNGFDFPTLTTEYDYITLIDVFHHIRSEKQSEFLEKIYMALGKDSLLIIKDIDASSIFVYGNKLHDLTLSGETGNEISMSKMEKLIKQTGFNVHNKGEKRMLWYPHYWFIVSKS